MIYLVTLQQTLFNLEGVTNISVRQSLHMAASWSMLQLDTETTGRDPHLCEILSLQLGDPEGKDQIVIDATTIDLKQYKELLESKFIIGQNLKFDLQFLFNYGIVPRRVYDTMIVEQLLYLGFPPISLSREDYEEGKYDYPYQETGDPFFPKYSLSFSLKAIAKKRLGIDIDKTVRGEIIWRGLDLDVITYAAGDVRPLVNIMWSQVEDCKKKGCLKGAELECNAVPSMAYLEWCGAHLDIDRWEAKMKKDKENLEASIQELNKFVTDNPIYKKFTYVNRQGDLFTGFDLTPKCTINWSSSQQVVAFAKYLGFDTAVKDKKTGEDKESVMEKHLTGQKGINDEFLRLYFGKGDPGDDDYYPGYSGSFKVVSSFGQGHLNAVNPKTGRIHTTYRQLGTASGRMSCGSQQPNTDLAKYKHISPKECTYPRMLGSHHNG